MKNGKGCKETRKKRIPGCLEIPSNFFFFKKFPSGET